MTDGGRRLRQTASRLGRRQTRRVLLGAAAQGFGWALLGLAALLVFDRFAPGSDASRPWALAANSVRALGFLAVVLLPVLWIGRAVLLRLPAVRDLEESARRTESESEVLREHLVPALQVLRIRDDGRTGYSSDLVDAFVDDAAHRVEAVVPTELPYNANVRRALRWGAVGAGALAVLTIVFGLSGTGTGLARLATAFGELGPQTAARFVVEPGDISVPRGERVALQARVDHARFGHGGPQGALEWRANPQDDWRAIPLTGTDVSETDADGDEIRSARFEHAFDQVRESFEYRFAHAEEASETFSVHAVPRPSLSVESVRYRYPEYTGLPDRVVTDGSGDLAALRGSVAEVLVRSTNAPESGAIHFGEEGPQALEIVDERHLRAEIRIEAENTYKLSVTDELGLTNPNPLEYRVRALSDEAPFIRLLEPGEDRDLDETMSVHLRFSAVDDYGLGPVRLVWEVSRREGEHESRVLWRAKGTATEAAERLPWDLSEMDLLPGDTVVYHLEVSDNNVLDGPRTARTRDYVLRFPTMGEIFAQIDESEQKSIDDLKDVVEEARKVEEKVEEISREILKQGESSWENQQEMQRALEQQQNLAGELQRTREEIEANLQQLAESEFATLEAMQKMEQIRKMLDEVATTEMKEALEKLKKAMEETNPRHQQEELAEFQETQDELMEQLDRIMENLKQFRLEEKMRAAVRELEELAARQERVNDELAMLDKEESAPQDSESLDASDEDSEGNDSEAGDESEGDESDPSEGDDSEGDDSQGDDSQGDDSDSKDSDSASDENSPSGENPDPSESQDSDSESSESESSSSEEEMAQSEEGSPQGDPKDEAADEKERDMDRLAREEEALAEEARRMQEQLRELAEMTMEMRDAQDGQGMKELSEKMDSGEIPESMDGMAEDMAEGNQQDAQEKGEKALTELREMLTGMQQQQQGMSQKMIAISQAAINRAVRDLLSLSNDEESLTADLAEIPRNSASATRSFADEQYLLIQGAERVENMLQEVAKDTPLLDSSVGRSLKAGLESMRDAGYGLENGAVHIARDDGEKVVDELNSVVIALLKTQQSMSSCPSGMPMPGLMQQLQQMSGDQQKLNAALKELMEQGGQSMDQRLQGQLDQMAGEQRRIQEELQQLLDEMGSGQGLLGRLDDVSKKLDETARRLESGELDEGVLRDQQWALTRLLDSQRAMRERDLGKERQSQTAEELADLLPPGALPDGIEELDRDLREDLLKALDRRYPPKYEELIRRYFRHLSDEVPSPDLP
ncbi:MAG: hypothetical protein DHS20C21_16820 [Gemmatimonadota bacterium]|nr:MAG: hypothetical protein DHS20C21_16820 [Gemmatimonadota bacterium]